MDRHGLAQLAPPLPDAPSKLAGYSGLWPRVYQSGESDRRGSLAKNGPRYLRWALVEAATGACRHPLWCHRLVVGRLPV